ncbi:MAG: VWA domain-containing protein [Oligoflexia bacterium]|nr:VWA domain-containing protein [Oligoflexia bacterium]
MRFKDWYFLLALVLIPLLHRWWMGRGRPARVSFSLPVPREAASWNPQFMIQVIKYVGLALMLVAIARPQTSYRNTERTVSGVDIMMLLDLSASMNIEDLGERSRIDIAKQTMEDFVKGRQNDRIGFVAFSGEPLTMAPPTLDYGVVLKALSDAHIGLLRDGTAIGDGLALAVSHLRNSKAKSRVVVLLTDGDNNLGEVDPATAGEIAAGYGIRVYTIAIGKEGRVKMPIRTQTPFGGTVTTYQFFDNALNPELLQQIAKVTNGRFYRVTDEETLQGVFHEIDQLEKSEIKSTEKVKYDDNYGLPLKWAFVLLSIGLVFELGWRRVVP